jgi:acyl carrier protein
MTASGLRELVATTVADVLGVPVSEVENSADLTAFPTFTSFRALDIVESVERRLAAEVDPNDLVPENLRHLDSLCAIFGGVRK